MLRLGTREIRNSLIKTCTFGLKHGPDRRFSNEHLANILETQWVSCGGSPLFTPAKLSIQNRTLNRYFQWGPGTLSNMGRIEVIGIEAAGN